MTNKKALLIAVIASIVTTLLTRALDKPQIAEAQSNQAPDGSPGRFQYFMHPLGARHQFIIDTQARRCWTPVTYFGNTPNETTVWDELPFADIHIPHDDYLQRIFDREKERAKGAAPAANQQPMQPLMPRN